MGRSWHLLYRKIFCRRGHGVHSPFVYHLITRVIEEKAHYYAYKDIDLIRKKLFHNQEEVVSATGTEPVSLLIQKYDFCKKDGELLFRLANFFKPQHIIQIAPSDFFSTLYLSWYAEQVQSTVIQPKEDLYALCDKFFPSVLGKEMTLKKGESLPVLQDVFSRIPTVDMVYLDDLSSEAELEEAGALILSHKHEHTILLVKGIYQHAAKRSFWKKISDHSDARVIVDLYTYGIILFNKKLHKRVYKVNY
ncbi:MAG: hypothetical protein LUG98_08080 [Tannerellaceae bacterium]|nr:hypothetical protein [Tannerellaceae bacterium]